MSPDVLSAIAFRLIAKAFDRRVVVTASSVGDESESAILAIAGRVYSSCYTRPTAPTTRQRNRSLLAELLDALPLRIGIDRSWMVEAVFGTSVIASRAGSIRKLSSGTYLDVDGQPVIGRRIGVLESSAEVDPDAKSLIYRFHHGGIPLRTGQVRFYFSVDPPVAAALVSSLAYALTDWEVPFSLKCPFELAGLYRRDAIVLYLDRTHVVLAADLIGEVCDKHKDVLVGEWPLFALPLRHGVAFAESPPDMDSFGMSRSKTCARALASTDGSSDSIEDRILAMAREFEAEGLSLAEPFRNPKSRYPYEFGSLRI